MEHTLSTLAILSPLAGLLIGAGSGVVRGNVGYYLARGYLVGCVGLLIYLAWCVPQWNRHYETKQRIPVEWKQNQPPDMRELIDPDAAETAMRVLPAVVVVAGLLGGWLMGWLVGYAHWRCGVAEDDEGRGELVRCYVLIQRQRGVHHARRQVVDADGDGRGERVVLIHFAQLKRRRRKFAVTSDQ